MKISLIPLVYLTCTWSSVRTGMLGKNDLSVNGHDDPTRTVHIFMNDARPTKDDDYLCSSFRVDDDPKYIVNYMAQADANTAHHILLYGCVEPKNFPDHGIWQCGSICNSGKQQIIFAWAKNAPPTHLPKDVGFRIGGNSGINYIVMQIHYVHKAPEGSPGDFSGIDIQVTSETQKYVAGIFLLFSYNVNIPPHTPLVHSDISCLYNKPFTMHPFAFRTHAHSLGRVISGYKYSDGKFYELGKGNPQWPQAFYPMNHKYTVDKGDVLLARCTFNSSGKDIATHIGSTGSDEMCNFYMMFYTDSSVNVPFGECGGNRRNDLILQLPEDSDKPLPYNQELEDTASGHHHHHTSMNIDEAVRPTPEVDYVTNWPQDGVELGQVGGVATDTVGNVYVFHRADRIWDGSSFNSHDEFLLQSIPIEAETIVVYNADGKVIRKWGANMFYMPHGITVDDAGNVWVTDVALHQVFRFPADGTAPDLVVGEKFKPGKDAKHFCKPSDIAILKSGEFYVSDGYCNHRIIKFSPKGVFLMQWGTGDINIGEDNFPAPGNFNLPHGITIAEEKNLVCVADRQNGRIQCFDLNGGFKRQMHPKEFGPYVYAVDYCPDHGGMLFAINGPSPYSPKIELQGFILNISNGDLIGSFKAPTPFERPHDIAVDAGTHSVYIGDLSGKQKIWKFNVREKVSPPTGSHVSVKKGDIPMDSDAPHHDDTVNQPVTKEKDVDKTASDLNASLIVGALLIIPVVLLIAITITVRLYRAGKLTCFQQRRQQKFSLGNFLNSHKGFDPLSTEESDHEVDPLNDSDNEEFSITRKA